MMFIDFTEVLGVGRAVDNLQSRRLPYFGRRIARVDDASRLQSPERRFQGRGALFFELRNIFDNTYVGAATHIQNTASRQNDAVAQNGYAILAQNQTGSIYAGTPRLFQGSVKFKF